MKVVTNDLYCGAYLLSRGGYIEKIEVDRRKVKPSVLFVFGGEGVFSWEQEFRTGRAMVNVNLFKANMTFLKDQMFHTLRNERSEVKG